jgi:ectoine hydroxylase-related dioxygenase (phytanoyl-CoA dioxygenase family)
MSLTQDQIDFFHEYGYLRYGKVLSDADIELFRREYDAEFEKARRDNRLSNLSASGSSEAAPRHMYQIMQMCERNLHFRRLLYDERILDIVQDLLGPNLMLFHDQALYKPALTGGPVTWHQDNAYWQCRPANLITCWLTFDDVDIHNGAMQVIPGSHLKPVGHEKSASGGPLLDVEHSVDVAKAVPIDLPAGCCMFHHCQTLHYTAPNVTQRQRRALAIHFMQPGTRDMHDPADGGRLIHAGFAHPVLRLSL